jgi:hypothetical protein
MNLMEIVGAGKVLHDHLIDFELHDYRPWSGAPIPSTYPADACGMCGHSAAEHPLPVVRDRIIGWGDRVRLAKLLRALHDLP